MQRYKENPEMQSTVCKIFLKRLRLSCKSINNVLLLHPNCKRSNDEDRHTDSKRVSVGAHQRHCLPIGHCPRRVRTLRSLHGESSHFAARRGAYQEEPSHPGDGHQSHEGGYRQDHRQHWSDLRLEQDRQEGGGSPARTVAGSLLRHQGWCCRRRLCPGAANGEDQSALHGRLPCRNLGSQHHQRPARQLHVPVSQRWFLATRGVLEARARRQRPRSAQRRDWHEGRRRGTGDGVRHHPSL